MTGDDEYPQPLLCLKPDINLTDLYDLRHKQTYKSEHLLADFLAESGRTYVFYSLFLKNSSHFVLFFGYSQSCIIRLYRYYFPDP